MTKEPDPPDVIPIRPRMPSRKEFETIVKAANAGEAKSLQKMERLLTRCPQIWQSVGNVAAHATAALIKLVAGDDQLLASSLRRKMDDLHSELVAESTSPLERLAVDRVVLSWAHANYVDAAIASMATNSPGTLALWLKRQTQASRQFDQAVKSLATLRKLLPAAERSPGKSRRA